MREYFSFDVFLSHSSKDKAVVRPIAERLRADGLRVWFDEWELRPGDSIPAKIEQGLEQSRVLVLCMSANALGLFLYDPGFATLITLGGIPLFGSLSRDIRLEHLATLSYQSGMVQSEYSLAA